MQHCFMAKEQKERLRQSLASLWALFCFDDTETRPMEPSYGILFISGINKLSVGTSAFVDRKSLGRV